jgi:hypothetical protein
VLLVAPAVGAQRHIAPTTYRSLVENTPAWARAAIAPPAPRPSADTRPDDVATWVQRVLAPRAPVRVYRPVKLFGDVRDPEPTGALELEDEIGTLAGTSAARWGVATARSDDPARPRAHDRTWLAAAGAGAQLLSRYGIPIAILPLAVVQGQRGTIPLGVRGTWALVSYRASPPAALVYEWLWIADTGAALARLFPPGARHGLDAGVIVLAGTGRQQQDEPSAPEPCAVEHWDRGAIDLACAARADAYAVISSSAATGWSVTVDGEPATWQTADVLRRAVAIPPGTHRVAWRYEVPGMRYALVIAALGVAGLVALWFVTRRPRAA